MSSAESRSQIFEALFAALRANTALMALLGPATSTNFRLYRTFPQAQQLLSSYEPQPSGEGWLIVQEVTPTAMAYDRQYTTIYEVMALQFHVFATRYEIADNVAALLDTTWHWSVPQQRDVQYGDWILLQSRRFEMHEAFAQDIKAHQKTATFWMQFVLATQPA